MSLFNFQGVSPLPFRAGGAITINRLVKIDTSAIGQVVGTTAATDPVFGVAMHMVVSPAASGDQVGVQCDGVALVEAGAAVTVGDRITSDGSGRGITSSAATDRVVGKALETAGGAGEYIGVKLFSGSDFKND